MVYIGATSRYPRIRFSELKSKAKRNKSKSNKIYRALNSDSESFVFKIVKSCKSLEEMYECEKLEIEKRDSVRNGYNESLGGIGNSSIFARPDIIRKSADSKIGKKRKPFTEETKKKMSISAKLRIRG